MTPSMKEMFSQHHRLTNEEREKLWSECIFTLDANALLNIYRYSDSTRGDLFRVLEALKGRVWISHQAAKEFYKNRITVIKEQRKKYDDLQSGLDKTLTNLKGGDFSKSTFLRIAEVEAIVKPAVEQAKGQIADWKSKHPDLLHDDPFLEQLVAIIGDSIGAELEKAEFEKCCNHAKDRIANKQPPGYMDEKKPEPDRYGDTLIWFEMLDHAKKEKEPLVLLTDDEKEDWWQIEAGEKLGPRPELREEIRKVAGVEFLLTSPAYFLQVMGDRLKLLVSPSSVENATNVAAQVAAQSREHAALRAEANPKDQQWRAHRLRIHRAEGAVLKWLNSNFNGVLITRRDARPFDFLARFPDTTVGIEVISPSSISETLGRIKEIFLHAHFEISSGTIADLWLFVVLSNRHEADRLVHAISRVMMTPRYGISIGYLIPQIQYEEVARFSGEGKTLIGENDQAMIDDSSDEPNET